VVVTVVGFAYLQNEINNLKHESTPVPTSSPGFYTNNPSSTESVQPTHIPQSTIIYTWYLKPELMNSNDWLKANMTNLYDSSKSWYDNYLAYLSSFTEVPEFVRDADLTGLVGAAFIMQLPVTVTYDNSTGRTTATYENAADTIFGIESALPSIAVNGNWTRTVI
jgi:hypothetical protein